MSGFLQILLFAVPWTIRRRLLCRLLGFQIDRDARIGFSILKVTIVNLGPGARIGHLTLIKGLQELGLGCSAILGNLNWITATPLGNGEHFLLEGERYPSLFIGDHAAITHRHLIDCTDRVTIGPFSTVGGWGSQILTHAIDFKNNRQSTAPVSIGAYCFVGTRAVFLKGSRLPNRCVLAAGSVLTRALSDEGRLCGGVPAEVGREIDCDTGYFVRTVGFVY